MAAKKSVFAMGLGLLLSCGEGELGTPSTSCDARLDWGRGGAAMLPGTDCSGCHGASGRAETSLSVGGTAFAAKSCPEPLVGAVVRISDAAGLALDLATNEVGNFSSTASLTPPLRVVLVAKGHETVMESDAPHGSCGACHQEGSALGFVSPPGP